MSAKDWRIWGSVWTGEFNGWYLAISEFIISETPQEAAIEFQKKHSGDFEFHANWKFSVENRYGGADVKPEYVFYYSVKQSAGYGFTEKNPVGTTK